ncbi:hypothetical protein MPER_08368, partial [Moniliophthora perniciosa FA553]
VGEAGGPKVLVPDASDSMDEEDEVGRQGNPGNFSGPILDYLNERLPLYCALGKDTKAKERFFVDFFGNFFQEFPIDRYPPPPRKPLPPLALKSPEELAAMTAKQRKNYKRKLAVRSRTPEGHMIASLKNWFGWRGGANKPKNSIAVSRFLSCVKTKIAAPRRRQPVNVVMSHPDYKNDVKDLSLETGSDDRLPCRKRAAAEYLESLDEQTRSNITDIIEKDYDQRVKVRSGEDGVSDEDAQKALYRRSFGNIMQHILDVWTVKTDLKIVVLAGEDLDGKSQFDTVVLSSGGPFAAKIDNFDVSRHDDFLKYFYRWLRDIRVKEQEAAAVSSANVPGASSFGVESDSIRISDPVTRECSDPSSSSSPKSSTEQCTSQPTTTPSVSLSSDERLEDSSDIGVGATEKAAEEVAHEDIVMVKAPAIPTRKSAKKPVMTVGDCTGPDCGME